jgi:tetratricopeptide (TPR) repeat protein
MKKIFGILFLLSIGLIVKAQSNSDLQKMMQQAKAKMKAIQSNPEIAAKMKMAQHMVDSLNSDSTFQAKMSGQYSLLDSLKDKYPGLAKYNMPQTGQLKVPAMPNFDSLSAHLDQSTQRLATLNKAVDQTTPKINLFHHANKLPKLSKTEILAMAQQQLDKAKGKLNIVLLGSLKKMVEDTNINLATTGAFILASGGDKNAAVYLICSGILEKPEDEWAINDLGVYFRDINDLEQSLQCYFYADNLYAFHSKDTTAAPSSNAGASGFSLSQRVGSTGSASSVTINTNIGWASAYYGDFETALKYFDKALAINTDFQSANEGKALIAYAKGDIAALFQCLAKEIKYVGGTGGPSTSFTKVACKAATDKMNQDQGKPTKDPSQDHTFDNNLPDEAPNTPPGADVDDVTLPQCKKIFVSKPEDIVMATAFGQKQLLQIRKQLAQETKALTAQLRTLKPLGQTPYIDEEGYVIYPSNFEKYVTPLTPIRTSFDKRLEWWQMKFYEKLKPFSRDVYYHDQDLIHKYFKELGNCAKEHDCGGLVGNALIRCNAALEKCERAVSCKWVPIIYKSKNSDLEALAQMWDEYYNHVFKAVNWYLKATAPFISRIHQEGWNNYLNAYRKYKVKVAYYELYSAWVAGLISIATDFCASSRPDELTTCNQGHNAIPADAPDPFSKKPKHIKEFEGNCFDVKFDIQLGIIHSNCHEDGVKFGNDNLNMCFSHTTDKIAAENHGYTNEVNFTASVEKDFAIAKIGEEDVSVTGGLEGNIDMKFDNDGNFTSGSSSVQVSASVGNVQLGSAKISNSAHVVSGALNVSGPSFEASGPSIK